MFQDPVYIVFIKKTTSARLKVVDLEQLEDFFFFKVKMEKKTLDCAQDEMAGDPPLAENQYKKFNLYTKVM